MRTRFAKLLAVAALMLSLEVAFAEEPHISLQNPFGISVDVNPDSGFYSVKYKSQQWLGDGFASVLANGRWYRSAAVIYPEASVYKMPDGRLSLLDKKTGSDSDRLGTFDYINLTWKVPDIGIRLVTGFRLYRDKPYLVFTQEFPDGFNSYSSGDWTLPSVAFPEFMPSMATSREDLYSWISGGMFSHRFAYGSASSLGGAVDIMLLMDKDFATLMLSPLTNYLVATQQSKAVATTDETEPAKAAIACGIEGLIQNIPAGFKHEHIMVVGDGVSNTVNQWGRALLDKSGKQIPSKYSGINLKYPTYWDDYGSYYREHGFAEDGYKTYEDIVLGIAADAKKNGLKIGAYEITDAEQTRYAEGIFEPRADLFPHGLKWLHKQLGVPLIAYIPWLAEGGPYRGKYPYFETPKGNTIGAFPGSMGDVFYSESFWKDTSDKLVDWGVTELQQDFLSTYSGDPVMMADLDKMNMYLRNQAKALEDNGLTMQYCMAQPRNIMASTENPIVTGLQATADHHAPMAEPKPLHADQDPYAWKHAIFTSSIYGAVGLWPSRDNIQTMADANAWEDILLANLMGGEIQLGHRIGEANVDLIAKTYRDGDGWVLKADQPVAPLDRCYIEHCAVAWTSTKIDSRKWFYLLSLPRSGHLDNLSMDDLHVGGRWAIFDYDNHSVSLVEAHTSIPLRSHVKHEYLVAAPILPNGMAVLGDFSKFVTMADMRIASLKASETGVDIGVIANNAKNPIIAGYSENRPGSVNVGTQNLAEQASLDRLQRAPSGWFWDQQSKMWYVKVNFGTDPRMRTLVFRIS